MKFTNLALGAASVASVLAAPVDGASKEKRAGKFLFTGVNESGGEFGQGNLPGQLGKDYTWPDKSTIDTLRTAGLNTFRIGTMMERIIPDKLTGAINETYFSGLEDLVKDVTSKGSYAVIDPHNYGRYYGNIITSSADFGAWWKTVAARFKDNDKVIFDTNNEYHDMDNSLVRDLNQAAIDNIRAAGATKQHIWIEGNSYSGAWHWHRLRAAPATL
nr:cellulase [Colletotrichum truncatum]KAF6783663.1 cellulase [Colletotrichum truncatum]